MDITPGTWTVKIEFGLSDKRFRDAVKFAKDAGGKFDPDSKTWTVEVARPETQALRCGACADGVPKSSYDTAADGSCKRCGGTCEITHTPPMTGAAELETLISGYGAIVERISEPEPADVEAHSAGPAGMLTPAQITAPGEYTVYYQHADYRDRQDSWTHDLSASGATVRTEEAADYSRYYVISLPDERALPELRSLAGRFHAVVRPAGHPKSPVVPDRYAVKILSDRDRYPAAMGTALHTDDRGEALRFIADHPEMITELYDTTAA